jgi:phage portal protein BeeE
MGQSWVTAALRDIQGDRLATDHKVKFFENGATVNLVVKGIPAVTKEQFDGIVDMIDSRHQGVANAYRTLYLTAGADATPVGADLKQLEFKATQGAGETRIAFLGRVPAPLLGISEGLAGSSLNQGNFAMARRIFADSWIYPSLQDVSASLESILTLPSRGGAAELWFDTADMPLLREDAKDAAEIQQIQATTITMLVREGFTAESATAAVIGQDMNLLDHTGLVSVQLQPPGTVAPSALPNGDRPALPVGKES